MNKNNLILLIKNQMSDKQKNENALHLNTLLLSSIENPSIDNDCFIELFSYYSNISQGEVSEIFDLLQSLTKNEINIIILKLNKYKAINPTIFAKPKRKPGTGRGNGIIDSTI